MESEDIVKVLNKYFASVFIKEMDIEDSEINVGYTNMQFEL